MAAMLELANFFQRWSLMSIIDVNFVACIKIWKIVSRIFYTMCRRCQMGIYIYDCMALKPNYTRTHVSLRATTSTLSPKGLLRKVLNCWVSMWKVTFLLIRHRFHDMIRCCSYSDQLIAMYVIASWHKSNDRDENHV